MRQKSHLGIYAIIEKSEHLLLVKKARGPYQGMWDLPGGKPAEGETPLKTLFREVEEETGIRLIEAIPHSTHSLRFEYTDANELISFHHTCLIYRVTQFDASQFQADIQAEDVSGSSWIKKTELNSLPLSRVALCIK